MAIPDDMQTVSVTLLKKDIKHLDAIMRNKRFRSRSLLIRTLIENGLKSFSLPECSVNSTSHVSEVHSDKQAAA